MTMVDALPEGVFRDDANQLARNRYEFRGFVTEDGKPWEGVGPKFEKHDLIPHAVIIALATDSDLDIERKRADAIKVAADFYHPHLGWLRNGRKREQEWPENLGNGVILRDSVIRPVATVDEPAAPATTVKGKVNG